MQVYYQIQYGDVHSDGCVPLDATDCREFLHKLLDELLDKKFAPTYQEQNGKKDTLDCAHFIVAQCKYHTNKR